jgi:Protein of unknown function (DUF3224)
MSNRATGTFDVNITPQQPDENADASIGRLTLDKKFQGDLQATSKGQMLAFSSAVQGSAGYVAMEYVTGSLHGKSGTFALQHTGTMNRGAGQLNVSVVPDSGTDQLKGLSGKMAIIISDGKHSYEFDYTFEQDS